MPLILGTNSIKDIGYNVANSLRLDEPSNQGLTKTPSGAGNRRTFTLSAWIKRAKLDTGDQQMIFESRVSNNDNCALNFTTSNTIQAKLKIGGSVSRLTTNRLFRDVASWFHLVWSVDTTQSTSSDRVKLYVNGVQETSFSESGYPSQNADTTFNNSVAHAIGKRTDNTDQNFDGYIAEAVMIDGQALTPTSFGEFNSDSPTIWQPIDVSGLTFGTNGFHLDFEDSSALGNDVSGNNNDYSVSNLSAVDQSTDTCTNNFATLNFLSGSLSGTTLSEGNLAVANDGNGWRWRPSTIAPSSGKWYAEFKPTSSAPIYTYIGVTPQYVWHTIDGEGIGVGSGLDRTDGGYSVGYEKSGAVYKNAQSQSGSWSSYTTDDIIGVALDLDNHKVYFSKNGTFQNSGDPTSGSTGTGAVSLNTSVGDWSISPSFAGSAVSCNYGSAPYTISSGNADANGYGNFEYSVPSGYYALNTKNLAEFG